MWQIQLAYHHHRSSTTFLHCLRRHHFLIFPPPYSLLAPFEDEGHRALMPNGQIRQLSTVVRGLKFTIPLEQPFSSPPQTHLFLQSTNGRTVKILTNIACEHVFSKDLLANSFWVWISLVRYTCWTEHKHVKQISKIQLSFKIHREEREWTTFYGHSVLTTNILFPNKPLKLLDSFWIKNKTQMPYSEWAFSESHHQNSNSSSWVVRISI